MLKLTRRIEVNAITSKQLRYYKYSTLTEWETGHILETADCIYSVVRLFMLIILV